MKYYLIAERYARSLDRALDEGTDRDAVAAGLSIVAGHYLAEHDLRNVLSNPAVSVEERAGLLREILRREEAHPHLGGLLETMLRRGRITALPDVATLFAGLVDERHNRASAGVTSAVDLTDDQKERIRAALESYSGMNVRADYTVDPEILGGVIARIKGKILDGSLRARIQRLRHSLLPEENLGG